MEISKTRKEKTVIAFFALVFVVVVAMAIIDPKPPEDHGHDDSAQSASLNEKIAQVKERLKADPNNVETLIYLGDLYMDSNQLKEAINIFDKVIKIEPQNTHALIDLGLIYQQSGFYDKSFEMFKDVEKIEPDNISALYYIGMNNRYSKKDLKEALKYFEKLLSISSDPSLTDGITKEIEDIKAETQ